MRTETALYVLISLLNLPFLTLSAGRVWFPVFRSVPAADHESSLPHSFAAL